MITAVLLRKSLWRKTSVIMASATLSVSGDTHAKSKQSTTPTTRLAQRRDIAAILSGLNYFARRVGAESATMLQVGTPFNYNRQMKLFVVRRMPDPRETGYREALIHWIEHFIR